MKRLLYYDIFIFIVILIKNKLLAYKQARFNIMALDERIQVEKGANCDSIYTTSKRPETYQHKKVADSWHRGSADKRRKSSSDQRGRRNIKGLGI